MRGKAPHRSRITERGRYQASPPHTFCHLGLSFRDNKLRQLSAPHKRVMARLARNANSDVVVQTLWFCPPHMPVKTFLLAVRSAATPAHAAAASARQCRLAWSCYAQVAAGTRPCTAPSRAAHAAGQCPRQGLLCAGHRSCLSALARRPNQATCTGDARTHARTHERTHLRTHAPKIVVCIAQRGHVHNAVLQHPW